MSKQLRIFAVVVLIAAAGFFIWQGLPTKEIVIDTSSLVKTNDLEIITVSYSIAGVVDEELSAQVVIGQTLLGLMRQINEADPTFYLETQDYPGLGSLVVQIGDLRNGEDNKYWQYLINDEMPMVGADAYILEAGDKIRWEFRESEF